MNGKPITRREFSLIAAGTLAFSPFLLSSCAPAEDSSQNVPQENTEPATNEGENMSILFINSSRNKEGNTASMGENLLGGLEYEKLDLIDYKLFPLGQESADDQFEEVWSKMLAAETIVFGTPVYWHTMASSLKILIDRMYDYQDDSLAGKRCAFICQGGAPTEMSLDNLVYTFERVAANYGMDLIGSATNASQVSALRSQLDAALA